MNDETVRVLLIDDDPDDYHLTKELLEEAAGPKFAIDWAKTYEAAVDAIANCDHDVYLVDYQLGKRDGVELLSEAVAGGCTAPLIMLTGAGDNSIANEALNAGASDYLVKGNFDAAALERTIRYSLQQARHAQQLEEKVRQRTADLEEANAALKVSEEFNRTVLENSPDCVKVLGADGQLMRMNANGLCLLEIDDFGEFEGREWESMWPTETQGEVAAAVKSAASGETIRFKAASPTAKGTPKWWDVIVAPIRDFDGSITRLISVSRDITDSVKAEEAIRESKERLQLASDAANAVIYDWDLQTDRIWRSKELFDLLGFEHTADTASNKWWISRLHPDDVERAPKAIRRAISSGSGRFEDEYRIRRKDGRYVWVFDRGIFISNEKGKVVRCVGSVMDISARKATEQALQASERLSRAVRQELETTYRTAPFGMCQLDRDLRYTRINDRLAEMNGLPAFEHLGRKLPDMVPDLAPKMVEGFKRILETGEPVLDVEISGETLAQPGVTRWWQESWYPQRDAAGQIIGINVVAHEITEKREAAELLEKAQERFRLAQRAGRVGIFDQDIAAGKTYWSETMWSIYGEEILDIDPDGEFWRSHLHGNDRDRVQQKIDQTLADPSASEFRDEFRILRPDGSIGWIDSVAKVLRDENGVATRMFGVNLDITKRREAEEQLRQNENQLRLVTDSIPALVSYIDSAERYRFINKKYTEWFGMGSDEILGVSMRDLIGGSAYDSVEPMVRRALAGEEVSFESRLEYARAGTRYVRISYVPDRGLDGQVNGFYALVSDFTDLQLSRDLLRATEDRVGLMMENLTDYAIIGTDVEGRVETWNIGAELIFGYPDEEITGQLADVLFTEEDRANAVPQGEMATARTEGRAADDRWHLKKDGSRFFANGVMIPLVIGERLTGYAKVLTDLTERKRVADELQRSHDELERRVQDRTRELADSNVALKREMEEREAAEGQKIELLHRLVSSQEFERRRIARDLHDTLGQRLTALRLKIASLKEDTLGPDELTERIERVQEIARRVDTEVSFLAWELRPSALDDLGLVDAIGAFVAEWSKHYEIEANFHSTQLSRVRLDPETETHLYRITQEALNNVVKHAKATAVTVQLEKRADKVLLVVEDNGTGFTPGKTSGSSGQGLGLIGMGERAALVGGEIEIESAAGKGTTIYVRVPFLN